MASKELIDTYKALRTAVGVKGGGMTNEVLEVMPDPMLNRLVIELEEMFKMMDISPTKNNMGGIVSLDQLTRPLGMM